MLVRLAPVALRPGSSIPSAGAKLTHLSLSLLPRGLLRERLGKSGCDMRHETEMDGAIQHRYMLHGFSTGAGEESHHVSNKTRVLHAHRAMAKAEPGLL